jgi:hypothetical protein
MSYNRRRAAVMAVIAVALATSSMWFFPAEGETRYTYDRAEVSIEGGEITYDGKDGPNGRYNELEAVDCQRFDGGGRRCAFDAYLAANGPINLSDRDGGFDEAIPAFVELSDGYYHRVTESVGEDTIAYDAEPIAATEVLAAIGTETAGGADSQFISRRVAVSGAEQSLTEPSEVSGLGEVYRVDGTDYVVVVTGRHTIDDVPVPHAHEAMTILGIAWLVGLGLILGREHIGDVRTWLDSLRE